MTIGDRIKRKRLDNDMTLEELASKVNLSRQTLSRYETGVISNIPSDRIESIAAAVGTTPAYLMGWDDDTMSLSSRDECDISKKVTEILDDLQLEQGALMFDGEPMDDETRELLIASLENTARMAKMMAKKKYTPNKYKK